MSSLSAWWTITTLLVAVTRTVSALSPSNSTLPNSPILNLTVTSGTTTLPLYHAVSLTGSTDQSISITGSMQLTPKNRSTPTKNTIVFISCNNDDYNGSDLKPSNFLNAAINSNAAAVVYYTSSGNWCSPQNGELPNYPNIFSMTSYQDAAALVGEAKYTPSSLTARIGAGNSTSSNDNGNSNNNSMWYAPPGTALAMIILYAITGCITALFIIVIITGTVRAHRHPERYGRRVIGGRTRQTRVGGLARAMLETFPLVKFGDKPQDKEDVEMTGSSTQPAEKSAAVEMAEKPADGIAAAASGTETSADSPGCSICTDDFEIGQDQRVLPCEHRFHPACIDPWLLNVSGTCPLCRVDLRPAEETAAEEEEATPEPVTPASRRRSVLMAITNLRRPDGMTREERLSALRRYRQEHAVTETPESSEVATTDEQIGRSAQLRRLFNVRTWRTTARRSTVAPSEPTQ